MNRLLVTGTISLALFIAGCSTAPAAAPVPGPAGPQGPTGQQGDPGQPGDRGREGHPRDDGRDGREGRDAPCAAGQHLHTNPENGRTECVRD